MMKNFKLIPLLLAAFLIWGSAAQALTLRIGAGDPENSEMGVVGNTFKKFIEEKTNGNRVLVIDFPGRTAKFIEAYAALEKVDG